MNPTFEYYNQSGLWREQLIASHGHVTNSILSLLPRDAQAILDAGCGNGAVTNFLPSNRNVIGCDVAIPALKLVNWPACAASLEKLPFPSSSFDLVLATDVLEHVPDNIYAAVCDELLRVTRRWLLIAVPYREILDVATVRCADCSSLFHVHWHQRCYDAKAISDHFGEHAGLVDYCFAGSRWSWTSRAIIDLRRAISGRRYAFDAALCPKCLTAYHPSDLDEQERALERRWEAVHYGMTERGQAPWPPASEIIALFDKQARDSLKVAEPEERAPLLPSELKLKDLPRHTDPLNYEREPYLIENSGAVTMLVLPRLPKKVRISHQVGARAFDHISQIYIDLDCSSKNGWCELPSVTPGRFGYLITFNAPVDQLETIGLDGLQDTILESIGSVNSLSRSDELRNTVGDLDRRVQALLNLSEELEQKRAAAEAEASRLQALLNQTEESQAHISVKANQKVQELLTLTEELEQKRAAAEAEASRSGGQLMQVQDSQAHLVEKADQRIKNLVRATEELESKRSIAETRVRELQGSLQAAQDERRALEISMAQRVESLLASCESNEAGRANAEREVQRLGVALAEYEHLCTAWERQWKDRWKFWKPTRVAPRISMGSSNVLDGGKLDRH